MRAVCDSLINLATEITSWTLNEVVENNQGNEDILSQTTFDLSSQKNIQKKKSIQVTNSMYRRNKSHLREFQEHRNKLAGQFSHRLMNERVISP